MLVLRDLHLAFGGDVLYSGLSWTIRPGERVGLVGPNGAGKSTLLRVIAGQQAVDAGEVSREGGTTVGYLSQDTQEHGTAATPLAEAMHAFDDVLALEAEERDILAKMDGHTDHDSDAYHALLARFDRVHSQLVTREAHSVQARTEAVLSGLGFRADEMERPLASFSGGWRMRVALARLLLQAPDVLLLDEPTNHLDIESIDWLEEYLKGYPGAVVLVSHDRYFLDRMTNKTAELVRGGIDEYAGNYSFYLEAREERRRHWQAEYDNQQKTIAEAERFIARFRAKATKASQAQSRIKMLERLERIPPPPPEAGHIRFRFPDAPPSGRLVAELGVFSKAYPSPDGGEVRVFEKAGPVVLERGDKVALVGKNGAGKSTLARMILGTEPFEGTRQLGARVVAAHFAQHQAEALNPSLTALDALREVARGQSETELRSLLGAFLFSGDDVFKPVAVLSGGERSRLALARTLLSPANLLVLDEPTNHLDIASKAVLAEALRQYSGTFVLVSHDRHFIDAVASKVWYVQDGRVAAYEGTYTEAQWQREHGTAARAAVQATPAPAHAPAVSAPAASAPATGGEVRRRKTKEEKRREAEERNARYRAQQASGGTPGGPSGPSPLPPPGAPAAGAPAPAAAARGGRAAALSPAKARRELERVEKTIAEKEAAKTEAEAALADPALYADAPRFQETLAAHARLEAEVAELYARWEALSLAAEAS
ncbi:MAG: ABC-F family ATP-binding cassette domain-containing protein [Rubricoccaceae bacterium]